MATSACKLSRTISDETTLVMKGFQLLYMCFRDRTPSKLYSKRWVFHCFDGSTCVCINYRSWCDLVMGEFVTFDPCHILWEIIELPFPFHKIYSRWINRVGINFVLNSFDFRSTLWNIAVLALSTNLRLVKLREWKRSINSERRLSLYNLLSDHSELHD